jgi:signal transduction histidine kinase
VPNLDVSNSVFWVRLSVENKSNETQLCIDLKQPSLDEVSFYFPTSDGYYASELLSDRVPISARDIQFQNYTFRLNISNNQTKTIYLKVKSGDQIQLPVAVGTVSQVTSNHQQKDFWFGIYSGIFLAMVITSILIYYRTKEKGYLHYVGYVLILYLTQANFQGYTLRLFWSWAPDFERYSVFVLSALVGIVGIVFIANYIQSNRYARWSDKYFKFAIFNYSLVIVISLLGSYNFAYNILQANASMVALFILFVTYKVWKQGNRQAGNLLLAWGVFLFGIVVFVVKDFGLVPYNWFTYNIMTMGSAVEGLLLSFGLSDKINQFKKEKELSQERMISVMKENQSLIEQQNIKLEAMVHERTQDLERANDDLSATLNDLKMTQKQLLESEKLASLGQMTAGIAHEINNPINFVSSNIQPLKRDVSDILTLLDEYAQVSDLEQMREKLPTLQKRYKDLDIDYLKREIDMLLHGIEEGSRRTAEIVRGLRIFSRMDRDALVTASINECLGSTLVVMKSVTKGEVTLVREMQDDLPAIDCYPGKLNQVFMNIINNAVQATKLPGRTTADRQVTIKTFLREDNVCISVTDNGCGIPEDVRSKIFDPFFTTKGVGEGTGLGLSIAMGIINEHHGRIEVSSEPNKGTEFLIILPRKMAMSKAA